MTRDPPAAQTFILRVWRETGEDGTAEWRGELKHVPSGHASYFRTLEAVGPLLGRMVEEPGPQPSDPHPAR